jgi:hypothetical protein
MAVVAGRRLVPAGGGWRANSRMRHAGPVRGCARVAIDARKAGVVGGDLMAIVANGVVVRNLEIGVVESGPEPTGGGVASVAGGGVTSCHVIRNGAAQSLSAVPGRKVTTVANRIGRRQRVVAIHMALRARRDEAPGGGHHLVCSRESKTGGAVVELTVGPSGDAMATGTSCGRSREIRRDVIGHITS